MNLLFRGFYGVPETVVNSSGDKINAIYGFFSLLRRVILKINPKFLVIIFDSETSSDDKKQINSQYKANRVNIDENIFYQLSIIQKSLDLMNIFWLEDPEYEADDIIGSYAKKFSKNDILSYITSNDNDFLQLLDPKIQIIKSIRGENILCNQDYFSKKFDIQISQYLEYMALVGDLSDNILGVKGIGKKRASQLLNIYFDINNVYKSFDKLSPHLKKILFNKKDEILERRDFFKIKDNIDVSFDLDKFIYKKESLPDKMGEFLKSNWLLLK